MYDKLVVNSASSGFERGFFRSATNLTPFIGQPRLTAQNFFSGNCHVETIIDRSPDFGVRLRNPECARALTNPSTNTNSAKQRYHQRSDRGLAGEPTGGLGVRARRHVH